MVTNSNRNIKRPFVAFATVLVVYMLDAPVSAIGRSPPPQCKMDFPAAEQRRRGDSSLPSPAFSPPSLHSQPWPWHSFPSRHFDLPCVGLSTLACGPSPSPWVPVTFHLFRLCPCCRLVYLGALGIDIIQHWSKTGAQLTRTYTRAYRARIPSHAPDTSHNRPQGKPSPDRGSEYLYTGKTSSWWLWGLPLFSAVQTRFPACAHLGGVNRQDDREGNANPFIRQGQRGDPLALCVLWVVSTPGRL